MSKENKTFRYQGGKGGEVQMKQQKDVNKNRVRVQAGDKCVPPAKSKPKKRKTVKEPDYSTLSMDKIEWSDCHYTVKDLAQQFHGHFPLLVKVVQGYYGEFGIELSMDQVLQVHSYGKQRRTSATDSQQRKISIPCDYPIEVLLPDTNEKLMFKDALRNRSLPLSVEVLKMSPGVELTNVNITGESIYVRKTYEDVFLRANTISGGWIDQREITLVPSFIGAEFKVATGMRLASEDEWLDYQSMFAKSVRHLLFNLMGGYDGIIVHTQTPGPYRGSSGIQFQFTHTGTKRDIVPKSDTPSPTNQPKVSSPTPAPSFTYENIPANHTNTEPLPPRAPKSGSRHNIYRDTRSRTTPRPSSKQDDFQTSSSTNVSLAPHYGGSRSLSEHRNESFDPPRGYHEEGSRYAYDNQAHVEEVEIHPEPSRANTPFSEIDENDIPDIFDNVIKVGQESIDRDRKSNTSKFTTDKNNRNISTDTEVPASLPGRSSKAVNVVPPTFKQPPEENPYQTSIAVSDLNKNSMSKIETMEDVPENLENLTVADVCQCLKLLNMDSASISQFQKHQIDGKLLLDLKEDVMITEFKFTPFNASKLLRFVRGWRPKLT